MAEYYDFQASDTSSIAVKFERYDAPAEIEDHMHRHDEFILVVCGACTHRFRGVEVPLIAGDVFIIPPHESHGYTVTSSATIANCYFFPERMGQMAEYVKNGTYQEPAISAGLENVKAQWDNLLATISLRNEHVSEPLMVTDNLSKQGVLHLAPAEAMDVENLLHRIEQEHSSLKYDSEYMKSAILQMILIIFKRARNNMPQRPPAPPEQKKQLILNSLIFLEENFQKALTVKEIADASSLSESYFRTVFKEVTGLSPLDYLNRMRVVKALEYIQGEGLSISDAAAKAGILDVNYFSRLFKKIIGHSPRYFKKIPASLKKEEL
ncbi:MAG: AraC family transcriptional regulator [Ruminococcus sp.]|jgi:YesN/AraC family two-component response regulator